MHKSVMNPATDVFLILSTAQPFSLQDMCVGTVRRHLGSVGLHHRIDGLPLPTCLKTELKYTTGPDDE